MTHDTPLIPNVPSLSVEQSPSPASRLHDVETGQFVVNVERPSKWSRSNPEVYRETMRQYRLEIHERVIRQKREWRKANRDKRLEERRRWRKTHPELARAAQRRWRQKHPAQAAALSMRWGKANPERVKAISRRSRMANREKRRVYYRNWVAAHPERKRAYDRVRGKRPKLSWLLRKVPGLKPVCVIGGGVANHADHIVPVSMGGTDEISNLRPLCALHNIARGPHRGVLVPDTVLQLRPCGGMSP